MRLIRKMAIWVCLTLLPLLANAASVPDICGEWTGTRPPDGSAMPYEQKWVLTFRQDHSFALFFVQEKVSVAGIEGSYNASGSNIVLQVPLQSPVPATFSIRGKDLKISFSNLTRMLGEGEGVDVYVRTKESSELPAQLRQKSLREGRYKLTVTLDKDNEESVLKDTFGDQFKTIFGNPIDGGTFPIYQLHGRNIIELPSEQFGPPEFNGESFKVFGAVAPKVNGDFSGKISSSTKVNGTFKSQSNSLHGSFVLEWVGYRE